MNFNFNETAQTNTVATESKSLAPNQIHDVIFKGCELIDNVQMSNGSTSNVLDIKFENEEGKGYKHRIFEPVKTADRNDFEDRQSQYGPNPSAVKSIQLLIRHLISAVNPKAEIKAGFKDWTDLRKFVVEATTPAIGTATKIKLVANNAGYATFPQFFAAYNREKELYMKSYFIGDKIAFTAKEQTAIATAAKAKPTTPKEDFSFDAPSTPAEPEIKNDIDFNL